MTVSYTHEVATCRGFGCFLKLLLRWRASIYKLIWCDFIVFLIVYYTLSLTYMYLLNEEQKHVFESIVIYCNQHSSMIPLSFVMGFYVVIVMRRWWDQYMALPWPDPIAVYVSAILRGQDERGRVMRRTVMRYVCLCETMMLSMISPSVKKRFPTLDHLVEAGMLVESEKEVLKNMDEKFPKHPKHWMPIVWAASIITRARKEGRIRDDNSMKTIIDELNMFRGKCGLLLNYDMICIPLVYTQVVTLAAYTYIVGSIIGQQWIEVEHGGGLLNIVHYYFPLFTVLEFFFFLGWLKVAESLICPFGDDDDDYEANWMIDRNLQASYLIVDEMHHEHPELIKDQYWDEVFPNELPYPTDGGTTLREEPPEPSTAKLEFPLLATLQSVSVTKIEEEEEPSTVQLYRRHSGFLFTPTNSQYRPATSEDLQESATFQDPNKNGAKKQRRKRRSASTLGQLSTSSDESDTDYFEELRRQRENQRNRRRRHHFAMPKATSARQPSSAGGTTPASSAGGETLKHRVLSTESEDNIESSSDTIESVVPATPSSTESLHTVRSPPSSQGRGGPQ